MAVLRRPRFAAAVLLPHRSRHLACLAAFRGRPVARALLLGPPARDRPDRARRRPHDVVFALS
eukprot:3238463-Alexandrium_andersonii.AAC.1